MSKIEDIKARIDEANFQSENLVHIFNEISELSQGLTEEERKQALIDKEFQKSLSKFNINFNIK